MAESRVNANAGGKESRAARRWEPYGEVGQVEWDVVWVQAAWWMASLERTADVMLVCLQWPERGWPTNHTASSHRALWSCPTVTLWFISHGGFRLCLSLSSPPSHSLSLSFFLTTAFSPLPLSVSHSLSLYLFLSLSPSVCVSLSVSLMLPPFLTLSLSLSVFLLWRPLVLVACGLWQAECL